MAIGAAPMLAGASFWWSRNVGADTRTEIDIRDNRSTRNDTRETTRTRDESREEVLASENAGDTSPHLGGRAQPGDVLGVETGGERTYVGDTSEDENKRRRDAEEAARKRND